MRKNTHNTHALCPALPIVVVTSSSISRGSQKAAVNLSHGYRCAPKNPKKFQKFQKKREKMREKRHALCSALPIVVVTSSSISGGSQKAAVNLSHG